jgi:hypothetical protein
MNKIIIKKKNLYKKIYFFKNILKRIIIDDIKIIKINKNNNKILKKKIIFFNKVLNKVLNKVSNEDLNEVSNEDLNKCDDNKCLGVSYIINKIKFCVFAGREKNIKVLHFYVKLLLNNNIIDEYHIFDFTRNKEDHFFIKEEYNRLNNIYSNRIFLHNNDNKNFYKIGKNDWSPFYKTISEISSDNDVIIKCDDDILFIDIFSLKNAIKDRINDKYSFLIHSNCINNGVCAYYQRNLFNKLKDKLNKYPTGGILGILFEKPEIAYAIHNQFCNDILIDINNINSYIIDDIYINTRISINFILINGSDCKYLKDITIDDEYEISSYIPEKLLRPNKIKGDLITAHLSYIFQEKIMLYHDNILNNYIKIKEKYIFNNELIKKYNNNKLSLLTSIHNNNIFKIKNWFNEKHYYIKNIETNKYLSILYENDEIKLSDINKTIFEINNLSNNIIEIKLGIYYLTRYNIIGHFRNENILIKYLKDETEKYIIKENIDNDSFYLKFKKYNNYISLNNECNIDLTNNPKNKWIFEKVNIKDEYIEFSRFEKNNKFYYKNIKNNELYTNYYLGWSIDNLLS